MNININATIQDDGSTTGKFEVYTDERGYELVETDITAVDFEQFMARVGRTVAEHVKNRLPKG